MNPHQKVRPPVEPAQSAASIQPAMQPTGNHSLPQPGDHPPAAGDDVQQLIFNQIAQWRPHYWEDDISRHALDCQPFANLPPITQRPEREFKNRARLLPDNLLRGRLLEDWIARDPFPIPCPEDREGYAAGFDGNYWMTGLADHLKIMQMANRYGIKIQSYFDFGCASGRVIRHFCAQTEIPEIWGLDMNARHIRWLCEFMPQRVRPIFNHCLPAVPIADHSIDMISAFSVFTHIDTFETAWLAELHRIVKPQGLVYVTVQNEDTWAMLRDEVDNPANRLVQSVRKIDPHFVAQLAGKMPDTRSVYRYSELGPYRAHVFHSNNYLQRVWSRFFQILEILPRHHVRQSVVVMRKQ